MIALLRRRARLLAHAEHELRGALGALALEAPHVDLSRARAGLADLEAARTGRRAEAPAEAVPLERLAWSAVARADLAARRAGGFARLDWRAGDAVVRADRRRLTQALANLLDNAIEHGGARVTVVGRPAGRHVRIVVRDEGAAAAALPLAAGAEDVQVAGRGHGLAIAAAAVRACGGRMVRVPSERGTAIALDLPLAR